MRFSTKISLWLWIFTVLSVVFWFFIFERITK